MKNYLERKLPLLYLLTACSFLMIYFTGDKISVFNFMLIPFYLFMIFNGQTGILGLDIHPVFMLSLDLMIISSLIYALYILLKTSRSGKYISRLKISTALVILTGFVIFQTLNAKLTISTMITLGVFFGLALTTLLTFFNSKQLDSGNI